jgi:hypothetical protein
MVRMITCPDAAAALQFGWSVAVRGDRLAVGAPFMAAGLPSIPQAGRVYLLGRAEASAPFADRGQLAPGLVPERHFGYCVALDGARLLVGAPINATLPHLGATFLFEERSASGGEWTLVERFTRPAGSPATRFGHAVGFQQGTAIVGAPADAVGNQGYAYLYRFDYQVVDGRIPVAPRAAWDAERFGDEVGNPWYALGLWSGSADPDADGTPNDAEYVFGGDPNAADRPGLLSLARDGEGHWLIGYVRRSNDPALVFTLLASDDLATWFDCTGAVLSVQRVPAGPDLEQVTLVLPGDLAPGVRFFKLWVVW